MTLYRVEFDQPALRELQKLPRQVFATALKQIIALAAEPRPAGCTALTGMHGALRVRVGDYRIVYVVSDQDRSVTIYRVAHRRDVYA